jgi:hypothetical protein
MLSRPHSNTFIQLPKPDQALEQLFEVSDCTICKGIGGTFLLGCGRVLHRECLKTSFYHYVTASGVKLSNLRCIIVKSEDVKF